MRVKKQSKVAENIDKAFVSLMMLGPWIRIPLFIGIIGAFHYSDAWLTLVGIVDLIILIGMEYRRGYGDGANTILAYLTSKAQDAANAANVMDEILRKKGL